MEKETVKNIKATIKPEIFWNVRDILVLVREAIEEDGLTDPSMGYYLWRSRWLSGELDNLISKLDLIDQANRVTRDQFSDD